MCCYLQRSQRTGEIRSFKTWLYTIGRNIAIDHLRRRSKKQEISAELCDELASEEESLETAFIREERKVYIHRASMKLKPEYRQVLWLIYFEELSNKEVASIMKKSAHSVEALAYRVRKSLKLQLEKEGFVYKEYKEMANDVIKRINKYKSKQKRKQKSWPA